MTLNQTNQELRNDLRAAALAIESAAQDLFRTAKSYAEPELHMSMEKIGKLHEHIDGLMLRADQVGDGLIVISCPE